jgi:hypothetical protein
LKNVTRRKQREHKEQAEKSTGHFIENPPPTLRPHSTLEEKNHTTTDLEKNQTRGFRKQIWRCWRKRTSRARERKKITHGSVSAGSQQELRGRHRRKIGKSEIESVLPSTVPHVIHAEKESPDRRRTHMSY